MKVRYQYKVDPSIQTLISDNHEHEHQDPSQCDVPEDDPSITDMNDGFLTVHTKPEIRKGCIWDIQMRLAPQLLGKALDMTGVNLQKFMVVSGNQTKKNKNFKREPNVYYMDLKIRSKLIRPVKEMPFCKVGNVVNEMEPVEVIGGIATIRVKFTARPRTVFHKHADMMILVGVLSCGDKVVSTTSHELIFRGGTGSMHSADSRKKALLNTGTPIKIEKEVEMKPIGKMDHNTMMETNMKMMNSVPMLTEFEDFDPNNFYDDFLLNKGDKLMTFDENIRNQSMSDGDRNTLPFGYVDNIQSMNQEYTNPGLSEIIGNNLPQLTNDNFSFSITGLQDNSNGNYQATIQGQLQNKIIRGNIQFKIELDSFKGSFSGSFT